MVDTWFPNGWAHYLFGGLSIGLGVGLLFAGTGLIGGASSVFTSTWSWFSRSPYFQQARFIDSRRWRLVYALGMASGAFLWVQAGSMPSPVATLPIWQLALGGFVAGFGARLANGCTSGHGICGMASLQLPSLLAVLTFLATAFVSAQTILLIGGR